MVRLRLTLTISIFRVVFNFNSCMVRLRLFWSSNRGTFRSNFNSCMVRLRLGSIISAGAGLLTFQFLYGTIKTQQKWELPEQLRNFNSCMVRLRRPWPDMLPWGDFYFNSCMVRLRLDQKVGVSRSWNRFQFLYGTIKTIAKCKLIFISIRFQFLYGTIKTSFRIDQILDQKVFQFLYGTIKTSGHAVTAHVTLISIPVWYD